MQLDEDTIVALATPRGRGALALIRMSGKGSHELGRRVIRPWPQRVRHATVTAVRDPRTEEVLDQVVATVYQAPKSYTGEDMVELSGHGGLAASAGVLALLLSSGAREARPGEFTQRALLAGKLDLLQAEAIADLVDARTQAMRRRAVAQLDGGLSRALAQLRNQLLSLEALLAYDIDFPEEDDGPIASGRIEGAIEEILKSFTTLLATSELGDIARDGARVVIAGVPNAGKSSLFNALLGEERAIVSDIPGTTRDALDGTLGETRVPLRLIDTAGLRESEDALERLGIEVSLRHVSHAHVVLACGATGLEIERAAAQLSGRTTGTILRVLTKADESRATGADADVRVSAHARTGLHDLVEAIVSSVERTHGVVEVDHPLINRERHRLALESAVHEMLSFRSAWKGERIPVTIAAVHLRSAVHALDELIGRVDTEDVLTVVFSQFCVGK